MKRGDYRQGDTLFRPIKEVPEGAKKRRKTKKVTVAAGEATGHHHVVVGDVDVLFDEITAYLRVILPAEINHPEHDLITLPVGDYEITYEDKGIRQVEYEPGELRRVAD